MKKQPQVTPSPNWRDIFKRRPDLEPPGYHETCALIRSLKDKTDD